MNDKIINASNETSALEFLTVLQMWGMPRGKAIKIVEHMLRKLNDSTYPWRDMTNLNSEETRNILDEAAKQNALLTKQ